MPHHSRGRSITFSKERNLCIKCVELTTPTLVLLSSASFTQQCNTELCEEQRNPAYPTLEPSVPHLTPWVSVHSKSKTKDGVGKTRWQAETDGAAHSVQRDVPHSRTGYLWQHLMLLKDCCGGCLVVCLAPTHLRTGRQLHSYVSPYITFVWSGQ